ncbi:helix-turn-helix domain-containing protein [Mesonia sp. K4-1]|uniref:helix-turn-helix domain-containing protein n=1 Tax=Mesonia sp. K4-1 TaxID=2602760 RepID=UPI0011CBD023|nr:helix-turn-helix transcriptional regulator [Mesonia sp. K4-1]TXK78707.1 helix-turn-helix transcriptional regulator [Mesonia sp. K4-1]
MELGKALQKILKQKGITQSVLAERVGKSPTAISQIMKGKYNPTSETLDKICMELNVPTALVYFLTISENDIPEEKKELYRMLAPSLKSFIIEMFGNDYKEVVNLN